MSGNTLHLYAACMTRLDSGDKCMIEVALIDNDDIRRKVKTKYLEGIVRFYLGEEGYTVYLTNQTLKEDLVIVPREAVTPYVSPRDRRLQR